MESFCYLFFHDSSSFFFFFGFPPGNDEKLGARRRDATDDRSGPLHFYGENHGPQHGIKSQLEMKYLWSQFFPFMHSFDVLLFQYLISFVDVPFPANGDSRTNQIDVFISFVLSISSLSFSLLCVSPVSRKLWWITPWEPFPTSLILGTW
jgi:hypothetical protein